MEDLKRLLEELSSKATSGSLTFPLVLWLIFSLLLALTADLLDIISSPLGKWILVGILIFSLSVTVAWWALKTEQEKKSLRAEAVALRKCLEDVERVILEGIPDGAISQQIRLHVLVKWLKDGSRDFKVKKVMEQGGKHYLLLGIGKHSEIQQGMHFLVFGEAGGVCRGEVEAISHGEAKLRLYDHKENTKNYWGDIGDTAWPFTELIRLEGYAKAERIQLLHSILDLLSSIGFIIKRHHSKNGKPSN